MLKLNDILELKDSAGNIYAAAELLLELDDIKIYAVAENEKEVMVRFLTDKKPLLYELRRMCGRDSERLAKSGILWPKKELFNISDELYCGFLAHRFDFPKELFPLSDVLNRGGDEINFRLNVALNLTRCFDAVNSTARGYVIGDAEPDDFFVDSIGNVFYFHAYNCSRSDLIPKSLRFTAPELIDFSGRMGGFSAESDAFALAVILFRLLTGVYPFGFDTDNIDDDTLADLMLNGESVYFYESSPECERVEKALGIISPTLAEHFKAAFDYCGRESYTDGRPTVSDWLQVLNDTKKAQ